MTADEIADAALKLFGRAAITVRFLAAGMLNQSWRVETVDGSCVLRVSRPDRTREQVAYEHDFLRRLKRYVSEVVAPLAGNNGETIQHWRDHILTLFPFVEGVIGEAIDPDIRWPQSAAILARLHRASLNDLHFGKRPGFHSFDSAWRSIWNAVNPVLVSDLAHTRGFDELFSTLESEVASVESWLDDLHGPNRSLVRTTIHGDFNPRNLIFRDDRLVAVIDWDECQVDPIAWEVAQVGFGDPDIASLAFWDAYLKAGGPLEPQDLDLMVNFARMGALLELQWTVKDGRATPHVTGQMTEVSKALSRIREIDV